MAANERVSLRDIDAEVERTGSEELKFLWRTFKRLKINLADLEDDAISRLRARHMGLLVASPRRAVFLTVGLAVFLFLTHSYWQASLEATVSAVLFGDFLFEPKPLSLDTVSLVENAVHSLMMLVLLAFAAVVVHRTRIHSWKTIAAMDLAHMLRWSSYREWFDAQERTKAVASQLQSLGLNDLWDNPGYRVRYQSTRDKIEPIPFLSPQEVVHAALGDVLGRKEDRHFQPGRFIDSLKDGKASVTAFVTAHRHAIDRSRAGELPVGEGITLLRDLLENHLVHGTPGHRRIQTAVQTLERGDSLLEGVVEARIWARDPWVDLTSETDFFSSASLRKGGIADSLKRRTKGALGPFGYLRNKSISALDFVTKDGRRVRARIAAATCPDGKGARTAVLFVDGVEGRFDVKPRLIRRAIEDYAKAVGFQAVFYYLHPLNKVPERFVRSLAGPEVRAEQIEIQYADHSSREYLDAFGYPFEPFEYAIPSGKAIGYFVCLNDGELDRISSFPSAARLFLSRAKKKHLLHLLVGLTLIPAFWLSWNAGPYVVAGMALAVFGTLAYQARMGRRSLRRPRTPPDRGQSPAGCAAQNEPADLGADPNDPLLLRRIREEVQRHPAAREMGYLPRLDGKVARLHEFFPAFTSGLEPFLDEILFNVSIKEGDLTNALRFIQCAKSDAERALAAGMFPIVFPRSDPCAKEIGLAASKAAREARKKALFEKIAAIQEFVKAASASAIRPAQIARAQSVLKLDILDVLAMLAVSPRILRGFRKAPRPVYAWILPTSVALLADCFALLLFPTLALWILYAITMAIVIPGTFFASMKLKIAPGILRYPRLQSHLSRIIAGSGAKSGIQVAMERLGILVAEYEKGQVYENPAVGARVVVHDKNTLEGAVRFFTSSEDIDNCIALQNFVSWTVPSLLNDNAVMLADIYFKGKHNKYQHRAQMWMVAAEEEGIPVLTVNSFEFNDEGAKYASELMPEAIKALQDVARRSGFKRIYAGVSDVGRQYLDAHFPQARSRKVILKIHHSEAGYRYFFDAYRLGWSFRSWPPRREFVYVKRRSVTMRIYALLFGLIEYLKGNRAKGAAFLDTARNANNFWEIPFDDAGSQGEAS